MEKKMDDMLLYEGDLKILYEPHQPTFQNPSHQFEHGEQSEEVGLIDDGFFDNLMSK